MAFDKYSKVTIKDKPPRELGIRVFVKIYYDPVAIMSAIPTVRYLLGTSEIGTPAIQVW